MESSDVVVKYGTAAGETHAELSGHVNEQIEKGWQPYGFPFIGQQGEQQLIIQAMVLFGIKKKITKSKTRT